MLVRRSFWRPGGRRPGPRQSLPPWAPAIRPSPKRRVRPTTARWCRCRTTTARHPRRRVEDEAGQAEAPWGLRRKVTAFRVPLPLRPWLVSPLQAELLHVRTASLRRVRPGAERDGQAHGGQARQHDRGTCTGLCRESGGRAVTARRCSRRPPRGDRTGPSFPSGRVPFAQSPGHQNAVTFPSPGPGPGPAVPGPRENRPPLLRGASSSGGSLSVFALHVNGP